MFLLPISLLPHSPHPLPALPHLSSPLSSVLSSFSFNFPSYSSSLSLPWSIPSNLSLPFLPNWVVFCLFVNFWSSLTFGKPHLHFYLFLPLLPSWKLVLLSFCLFLSLPLIFSFQFTLFPPPPSFCLFVCISLPFSLSCVILCCLSRNIPLDMSSIRPKLKASLGIWINPNRSRSLGKNPDSSPLITAFLSQRKLSHRVCLSLSWLEQCDLAFQFWPLLHF